jgi:hypothetical protein
VDIAKLIQNFNITGDGEPEGGLGGCSTPSVFRVLRVNPILGRVLTEDDGPVEDKVVLSEGLWKRRYEAAPAILGKTMSSMASRTQYSTSCWRSIRRLSAPP